MPLRDGHRIVGLFGLVEPRRRARPAVARPTRLTPRQQEVLELLGEGASTADIQGRLHISRDTARNHIRNLLRALEAHSRLEAVAKAHRLGLLD